MLLCYVNEFSVVLEFFWRMYVDGYWPVKVECENVNFRDLDN